MKQDLFTVAFRAPPDVLKAIRSKESELKVNRTVAICLIIREWAKKQPRRRK